MKSLPRRIGLHGIRVNGIAPGGTGTPRMLQTIADAGITLDEPTVRVRFGRRAADDESAAVALFLASADATRVQSHMLVADGGFLCA